MSTATGIPTKYLGRQYRSRLEATYAAFFHLIHWDFEYEPMDCAGWIPDFSLIPRRDLTWPKNGVPRRTVLVEVKPVAELHEKEARDRIAKMPDGHEFLMLGMKVPQESCASYGRLVLGWHYCKKCDCFYEAYVCYTDSGIYCGALDIVTLDDCRDVSDRETETPRYGTFLQGNQIDRHNGCNWSPEWWAVVKLWNEARNMTQWNPPS